MRSTKSRMLGCLLSGSKVLEIGTLVGLLPFFLHFYEALLLRLSAARNYKLRWPKES